MSTTLTETETEIETETERPAPTPGADPTDARPPWVDDAGAREVERAHAEHTVLRDGVIGAVIGALVLAPIWAAMVLLALRNSGTALVPPTLMAAGVGVIAGVFMGGWAGTLLGTRTLEHFEHEIRPPLPGR